jgi:ABC-2 type transport system permease protein
MKKILFLALKDLRILFSDKGNIFFVFGFPALFALFFGFVFAGSDSQPSGMKIALVDQDKSEFSSSYISLLDSSEALRVVPMGRDEAIDSVRTGKLFAAVILKNGFGNEFETMFTKDESRIEIASDPSRKMESQYLQGLLAKAQFQAMAEKFTDRDWMRNNIGDWRNEVANANDIDEKQSGLFLGFFDAFDRLLKDVNDENFQTHFDGDMMNFATTDISREREGPVTSFQITFPQAMIWGILGCAVTFAISIVQERTKGTFERLQLGPIGRAHILGGKGTACFITCVFVVCFLYIGAKLIFKLPIRNLPLFILAAVCVILCFVGLMMFICTLGRTEQSAGGAGWAMLMVMTMLGGGMVPLVFMPSWLRSLSHISPVKWSIFALEAGVWRNLSFVEMIKPLAILLAIGATAFMFGISMLRRQDK